MTRVFSAAALVLLLGATSSVAVARIDPAPITPPPRSRTGAPAQPDSVSQRPPDPTPSARSPVIRIGPSRPRPAGRGETIVSNPVDQGLSEAAGFLRQGKIDEGIRRLQDLQTAYPKEWRVTLALGRTLDTAGRRSEALALYRKAATDAAEPGPCLIELERLQRVAEDWDGALNTCLEYLERVGDQDAWLVDEVESMVRSDQVGPQAIRALEKARSNRPDDGRLRELLIVARLHQGEADRAMEEAAAIDREQKARGAFLIKYAALAQDKKLYPAALQGLDRVLQLDPPDPVRDAALLRRARTLRAMGKLPESLAAFDAAARASTPEARALALSDKADLLADDMKRPAEALDAYASLLDVLRRGTLRGGDVTPDRVRLAMADLRIRLEQPGEAALLYRALADSAADTEVRAEALYHAGEMLFFQGKLKEAQDTWYQVIDTYGKSRWVNDALAGVLMIGEDNDEGGIPLTALAQAIYQQRLGHPDRGIQIVDDALTHYRQARAGDRLLNERVLLLLDLARTDEARVQADSLATRYPDSEFGSQAFLAVANRLAQNPATTAEAEAVYLELLTRFPDSLEATQARTALQSFRDRGRGNSERESAPSRRPNAPDDRPTPENGG